MPAAKARMNGAWYETTPVVLATPERQNGAGAHVWRLALRCGHVVERMRPGPFSRAPRNVICTLCSLRACARDSVTGQ